MIRPDRPHGTPVAPEQEFEVRIESLGQEGDGVARQRDASLHVRYALGGETVLAEAIGRNRAIARSVLTASPDRVTPPCSLFGACGGCVLQHLDRDAALAWKRRLVESALTTAGLALPQTVACLQSPPRTRRRMDLAVRRGPDGVTIGLHVRGSEQVIGLSECHVLDPALFALTRLLQPVLTRLQALHRNGSASVNLLDSGPDILLSTDGRLEPRDRAILADFAAGNDVPRIAWQPEGGASAPELVCGMAPVAHRFGDVKVSPPPGAFLQATPEGEAAIVAAVLEGLPGRLPRSARIVELFAGCGTISFALADRARVTAVEGHAGAAAALRAAGAGRRIDVQQRDLNRQPLLAHEFAGAVAIVLDPPHPGAGAQMREVAASGVPSIIYVSCNPAALAHDARLLAQAGYRLQQVTVIDQFLWSARAESVSVFTRDVVVRRGPLPRPERR